MPWYMGHPELVEAERYKGERALRGWGTLGAGLGALGKLALDSYKAQRDRDRALNAQIEQTRIAVGEDFDTADQPQGPTGGSQDTTAKADLTPSLQDTPLPEDPTSRLARLAAGGAVQDPTSISPAWNAAPGAGSSPDFSAALPPGISRSPVTGSITTTGGIPPAPSDVVSKTATADEHPVRDRFLEMLGVETEGRTKKLQRLAYLQGRLGRQAREQALNIGMAGAIKGAQQPERLARALGPDLFRNVPEGDFAQVPRAEHYTEGDVAMLRARGLLPTATTFPDKKVQSIVQFLQNHGTPNPAWEDVLPIYKKYYGQEDLFEMLRRFQEGDTGGPSRGAAPSPGRAMAPVQPTDPIFDEASAEVGGRVPATMLRAIAEQESSFDPGAVNPQGPHHGAGLMGFVPSTWADAARWGGDPHADIHDPRAAVRNAAHYLDYLLTQYPDGDEALKHYGPGTEEYVTSVFQKMKRYQDAGKGGSRLAQAAQAPPGKRVIKSTTGYAIGTEG